MRITVDQKNPNAYAIRLGQSGLGMPDRDYYLGTDKQIVATREAYKKYIVDMLTFAGVKDAAARGAAVYALEAKIADAHWPAADRRDADKTYNPMTIYAARRSSHRNFHGTNILRRRESHGEAPAANAASSSRRKPRSRNSRRSSQRRLLPCGAII
jgi:predicted metalloendopeptidase